MTEEQQDKMLKDLHLLSIPEFDKIKFALANEDLLKANNMTKEKLEVLLHMKVHFSTIPWSAPKDSKQVFCYIIDPSKYLLEMSEPVRVEFDDNKMGLIMQGYHE